MRLWRIPLAVVAVAGCVSVLSIEGYADAIRKLCQCDQALPDFGGRDCVDVLSSRLDGVTPKTRESWLAFYANECAGECANANLCYAQPGTCSQFSCSSNAECCGFLEEGKICDDGACKMSGE